MYKGFRSGFSLLAGFALGSACKQQKQPLAVSEDVVTRTHSPSPWQGSMPPSDVLRRVFRALVLIHKDHIHGDPPSAPPQGTREGMETVRVGRNRSGRWELLDWLACKRKCLNSCTQSFLLMGKRLYFNDVFDTKGHGASVHSLQ